MSDFDDIMRDADTAIFDVLGSNNCPLTDGTATLSVQAAVEHNLEMIIDGMVQLINIVITINQPPAGVANGWQITVDGVQYQLLERIEKDGFISRWTGRKVA